MKRSGDSGPIDGSADGIAGPAGFASARAGGGAGRVFLRDARRAATGAAPSTSFLRAAINPVSLDQNRSAWNRGRCEALPPPEAVPFGGPHPRTIGRLAAGGRAAVHFRNLVDDDEEPQRNEKEAVMGTEPSQADVARATQLADALRRELADVEGQIRRLPFFAEVENGRRGATGLLSLLGEQRHVIAHDLRSCALLVSRFGTTPAAPFFKGILDGEMSAGPLLLRSARALGITEDDLDAYEPRAGAQAYPSYVALLAVHGSEAEVAAAFLVNFPVFGESLGRISAGLRRHHGSSRDETAFFDLFAAPVPSFEHDAITAIACGLGKGVQPRVIRRAARLLQFYEKLFWETVSGEPGA